MDGGNVIDCEMGGVPIGAVCLWRSWSWQAGRR